MQKKEIVEERVPGICLLLSNFVCRVRKYVLRFKAETLEDLTDGKMRNTCLNFGQNAHLVIRIEVQAFSYLIF